MGRIVLKVEVPNQHPVTIRRLGKNRFSVEYGKEIRHDVRWGAASIAFGSFVFHALECNGDIDRGE